MGNVTLINDQVAQGWYDSESRRPVHNLMICCTGDSESRYYVWESSDSEPGRLARPGPGLTSTIKSSQLSAAAPAATQPSARRRAPSLTVHARRRLRSRGAGCPGDPLAQRSSVWHYLHRNSLHWSLGSPNCRPGY